MKKPIEEWLSELPDGYRERALENRKKFPREETVVASMDKAVLYGFWWCDTREGSSFWEAVCDSLRSPLHPLPE